MLAGDAKRDAGDRISIEDLAGKMNSDGPDFLGGWSPRGGGSGDMPDRSGTGGGGIAAVARE